MEKSHVSMEQKKCAICTKDYDSGAILLDKRLRQSMERHTLTGWGTCPDCSSKIEGGYLPLVVIDPSKSEVMSNGNVGLEGAWRTGEIMFIKRDAAEQIFRPVPKSPFTFIDVEASNKIKAMIQNEA